MQLHTVSIFYRRQSQPAQYEAEEVRLEGSATVEEGEDFEAVAYDLVTRARVQAHRALGLKVPAITPFEPSRNVFAGIMAAEEAGADFRSLTGDDRTGEANQPKRKRRTKAEMEADRLAAEAGPTSAPAAATTAAAGATEDDFVIGDEPKAAAAEPEFDITAGEPKEISDQDLQARAAATARKIGANGAQSVKDLMKEFGVGRLGELAQDKRGSFLAALEQKAA